MKYGVAKLKHLQYTLRLLRLSLAASLKRISTPACNLSIYSAQVIGSFHDMNATHRSCGRGLDEEQLFLLTQMLEFLPAEQQVEPIEEESPALTFAR